MLGYEKFKQDVFSLTNIDLNAYKEKQMKRRIDTLIGKNNIHSYDDYVKLLKAEKDKFEQFVNFLTINVSEFYRNPEQWKILDQEVFPSLISKFIALPKMKKYPFSVLLLDDTNKDNFVKEDGKIIVYSLENGKVVKIDKISTKEELAKFIK